LAGNLCGSKLPDEMTSTTGFYLVFKADSVANGYGFKISYQKTSIVGMKMQICLLFLVHVESS